MTVTPPNDTCFSPGVMGCSHSTEAAGSLSLVFTRASGEDRDVEDWRSEELAELLDLAHGRDRSIRSSRLFASVCRVWAGWEGSGKQEREGRAKEKGPAFALGGGILPSAS